MKNLLVADNISKSFNGKNIVKPVNFTIQQGSIHVIEGKSGSGKSTLLSMLGGMEKPDRGDIRFNGHSLYRLGDNEQSKIRGTSFGYVFQSFHLIPELTVKENIELPLQFNSRGVEKDRVSEIANRLGIASHLHKRPDFLSGGEQQRVAIARAVIMEPQIIFADEPTGNLDQTTTKTVIELLSNLTSSLNIALVVVTHEQHLFTQPHHLYTMEDGSLKKVRQPHA
ncbi:ABC transporter ATP-binding protein [Sporosarcina sp. FSL K6-1522]|uniref:ABC transporter ATP-binding protein n=1 Tax=Sporosarcina sp. FSL K6-1522 TaxID=2921554 RepID=UPI00315A6621